MGVTTLVVLLSIEAFFLAWAILSKRNHREEKSIVRIGELLLVSVLLVTGILEWGFRYFTLLFVLIILAVNGATILLKWRKKHKPYKLGKSILHFINCVFLFAFSLFFAILCPQYEQPQITGDYAIATAKYTWTDESRKEEFSQNNKNRTLTVEFWYPQNGDGVYPLVVFSHGAFGFSGSNYSTFAELASNGYVVASIGHTYHALFTQDTSDKITIANMDFLNTVIAQNNTDNDAEEFANTQKWLKLRVDDENFVIDTILENTKCADADRLFTMINMEKIGAIGHSLGGASSAQLGRARSDIGAVINLDGTMLGEELGFENGELILNDTPFPVPLLNIYSEFLYDRAAEMMGSDYEIFEGAKNAVCVQQVIFKDTGHLNFTDLPLFSPPLAKLLGVGTVDAKSCIEKTNAVVLDFFDCYLKDGGTPRLTAEEPKKINQGENIFS